MATLANKTIRENPDFSAPEPGFMRVGPVVAVPALLQMYANQPAAQIVAEVGLDMAQLEDPDNCIPFVTVGRLLSLCAECTGLPHFGLLLGQRADPEQLGQLGKLAIYAPTAGSALRSMILHICAHDRGGVPTLTSKNGVANLGYAIYVPMHEGVNQVCNTSIAIMYSLLRSMFGMSFTATEVCFTHSRPSDIKPYESFFQAPLLFEADENVIVFPEDCLKKPLTARNGKKYNDVMTQLSAIESDMDFDICVRLPMILRPLVVSKSCTPEHIASLLSLHPRTLNRRLEHCGMTLRGMVGAIRFEIAKQLLAESSVSLIKISILLGYADSSAFTHAFRRWSGMSPSAWRVQNRQSP